MNCIAFIQTDDAQRICQRLVNHWKHKFAVEQHAQHSQIFMPEHSITLIAHATQLEVHITSEHTDLSHMQQVVLNHLNRMAKTELTALWQ